MTETYHSIDRVLLENNILFNLFDDQFYIYQRPNSYSFIQTIPDKYSNKQKLFYHFITHLDTNPYLNQQSYEIALFGDLDIDPDFDEKFYMTQYPETKTYYFPQQYPISDKIRLYHHYITYGKNNTPPYFKNKKQFSCSILGLESPPPDSFDGKQYSILYKETKDYFYDPNLDLDLSCKMYHHYINYGRYSNYIVNYNIIPIFYHIPKCGGTSVYQIMLNNLYNQYIFSVTNKIFYLNFINIDTKQILFSFICYPQTSKSIKGIELNDLKQTDQLRNIYRANISLSDNILLNVQNNFNILGIIINPSGFYFSLDNIDKMIPSHKSHESYIVLRDPFSWHKSLFYYLRDMGKWEYTSMFFDKNLSFSGYINSEKITDSWLIRSIRNLRNDQQITETDYEFCIDWLKKFTYVGFLEKFDELNNIFTDKYNWKSFENILNKNTKSLHDEIEPLDMLKFQRQTIYDHKLYYHFYNERYAQS